MASVSFRGRGMLQMFPSQQDVHTCIEKNKQYAEIKKEIISKSVKWKSIIEVIRYQALHMTSGEKQDNVPTY